MRPKKDPLRYKLYNQRFGLLTAIEYPAPPKEGSKKVRWKCVCDCKEIVYVVGENLRTGIVWACPECKRKALADKLLGIEKIHEAMRTPRLSDD